MGACNLACNRACSPTCSPTTCREAATWGRPWEDIEVEAGWAGEAALSRGAAAAVKGDPLPAHPAFPVGSRCAD